jgi:hypothetical protein
VDHPIQLSLLPALLRRLQLARSPAEHASQVQRLLHFNAHSHRAPRAVGAKLRQQPLNALLNFLNRVGDDRRHCNQLLPEFEIRLYGFMRQL